MSSLAEYQTRAAATSGATFGNVSPRDGSVLNHVPRCNTGDVDAAVRSARAAFEDGRWRKLALRAGLVWVNGRDACDIIMPFGGFQQSGCGRDRSPKYADLKSITFTIRDADT